MRSGRMTIAARLLVALTLSVLAALAAPIRAWAGVSVSDPRVVAVADSSMTSGQVTTWDCVWLGSYPQAYVDDAATVAALDAATGWDADGDLTYGGQTYRRLASSDATHTDTSSGCWSWSTKASAAGWCYFLWEPVKWRALEADGSTALVVSDVALDDQRYNETHTGVTWATCTLRGWLNGAFRGDCLTTAQQGAVVEQTLDNADSIHYGTSGGAGTTDSVFLLAESDVWNGADATRHGFATSYSTYDEARRCKTSDYAHAMGAWNSTSPAYLGNCWWWLRSPGYIAHRAARLDVGGDVYRYGHYVDDGRNALRPALRISLSSNQITWAGTVSSDGTVDEQAPSGGSSGGYDSHDLANAQVSTISVQSYTGSPVEPDFTVRMGLSTLLRKGRDYTVSYTDNVEVGTATLTVTGAGDYHGSISRTFLISNEAEVLWAGKELDLGFGSASFTLDDDVPILGGDTFKLDFPVKLPIQTVFEDGKVKVGINLPDPYVSGSKKGKAWEWTTERKSMREQWEDFCKDAGKTKDLFKGGSSNFYKKITDGRWKRWNVPGMSKSAEVSVTGYLEYAYGEKLSDAAKLEGSIVVTAKGSATAQKQGVVGVIPVTGSIKFTAEGAATGTLAWNIANSSWSGDLQLAVAIGMEPYFGVGVGQWASVGGYGSGKTGVELTILSRTEPLGMREWYLYGEAGVRAYFAKKAFTWTFISTADLRKGRLAKYTDSSGHLRLWSKTQASLITGNTGAGLKAQSTDAGEELLASAETLPLTGEEPVLSAASDGLLVEGAYPGAEPAVLDVGGKRVLVYVGQDAARAELDQTVLYYRTYDADADAWGEPAPVFDDGTADCMPTVLVDGGEAYVAWLDAAAAFGDVDVDAAAYMASFSARVARWDAGSGSFVDLGRPAGDGAPYAYLVALSAGEGGLVATWAENADGAAFGLSAGNCVRQAAFDGATWGEPVTLADGLNAVTSVAARGGRAAWAVDEDNDLSTAGQLVASTEGQLPAGDVASLAYVELPGVEGVVLAANVGGGLSYCDGAGWAEVLPEGTMGATSRFCVDGNSVYYVRAEEDASHVAVATYDGGEWGTALVTTDDGYVDSLSDPCGTLALTHTSATPVEETGEWSTFSEVRVLPSKERADVALEAVDLASADLAPGATVPATLYVTNEGTSRLHSAHWGAALDGAELASGTAEVDLMPGESGSFEVELALPADLGAGALTFWASADGDDDAVDGAQELAIARPDLAVTAEFMEGTAGEGDAEGAHPMLVVTVANVGTMDADATTTVTTEAGTELLSETGTITAGESVTYTKEFGPGDVALPADGSEVVLISRAATEAEEFYESNNVDYAVARMRYLDAEGAVVDAGGGGDTDPKAPSTISLAAQTKTYTGKALAYSGKVTRSGSTGKVTYAYYSDAKCTKAVKAANVKGAGTYYVRATLAADDSHDAATSKVAKFTIAKAKNPIAAKGKSAAVKLAAAKKKAQVLAASKVVAVTKAQGKRTYKVVKWTTAKAKKYITVNAKTGKVTIKKGTPKGTYQFKLEVKAAGNANYKTGAKTVAVKVVVK